MSGYALLDTSACTLTTSMFVNQCIVQARLDHAWQRCPAVTTAARGSQAGLARSMEPASQLQSTVGRAAARGPAQIDPASPARMRRKLLSCL